MNCEYVSELQTTVVCLRSVNYSTNKNVFTHKEFIVFLQNYFLCLFCVLQQIDNCQFTPFNFLYVRRIWFQNDFILIGRIQQGCGQAIPFLLKWAVVDPGFSRRGRKPLRRRQKPIIWQDFAENCMNMKEIRLGGDDTSLAPPPSPDPPMMGLEKYSG